MARCHSGAWRGWVVAVLVIGSGAACDAQFDPKQLDWLANLLPGKPIPSGDVSGACFSPNTATFSGGCIVKILPSSSQMRRAKLRRISGVKVTVAFTPAEGSPIEVTLSAPPHSTLDLVIPKGGASLAVVVCVPEQVGLPCSVELHGSR